MNDDDGLLSLPGPRIGFDVALGLAAAIPTLAGAAFGAWLALDDWSFAAAARFNTFTQGFGTQTRQRPLSGVSDWTLFHLFGTHPVPHLMVLAVLNAAAAVLLWHLLDRWLPRRIAALTAVAWVALPNRGSTRLWVTTTPLVLSLVLLLAALFVASGVPFTGRRLGAAIGLVVLSALAYEGGIGIGVAGLLAVVWTRAPSGRRLRWSAATVGVIGAVGGWVLLSSPKVGTSPPPFRNLSHLTSAHFGDAVLSNRFVAAIVLGAVAWCVAVVLLPHFEAWLEQKLVVVGLGVILLGSAPFVVVGFPFSSSGFFDRGNLYANLGTALVYGSLLAMLFRLRWRAVAIAAAVLALAGIAAPNVRSVHAYTRAGRDGRRLLAAMDQLPVGLRTRGPVTFLPLRDYDGVATFLADYDISAALALRYNTGEPFPRAAMAVTATGFKGAQGPVYRFAGGRLVLVPQS